MPDASACGDHAARVLTYLVRRLVLTVPVLLGVATLVFALIHLVPGDPAEAMLGESAPAADLADLRLRSAPEIRRRDQTLHWTIEPGACDAVEMTRAQLADARLVGKLAADPQAYSYLPSSVRRFPGPDALAAELALLAGEVVVVQR